MEKCLYVLIDGVNKIHYGCYHDEFKAREVARDFEKLNKMKPGSIDIYEITESWIDL